MTDNKIIESMEYCLKDGGDCGRACPFYYECVNGESLSGYALEIIKRQKEEIEKLENGLAISRKETKRYITSCKAIRDEAIKKFVKTFKRKAAAVSKSCGGEYRYTVDDAFIDELVKETERENNA